MDNGYRVLVEDEQKLEVVRHALGQVEAQVYVDRLTGHTDPERLSQLKALQTEYDFLEKK